MRGSGEIRTGGRCLCSVPGKYARSAKLMRGPDEIRARDELTHAPTKIRTGGRCLCAVPAKYARAGSLRTLRRKYARVSGAYARAWKNTRAPAKLRAPPQKPAKPNTPITQKSTAEKSAVR
ncbi:hypothetical protein GPDM_15469 [Planococcus donghaensis MPA1U2]|uniref:Uncharacterized protein n=1 Tax=Planococcus donghaensis MPA1U2 TaxID=933115 RepID=E7RKR9_9BACL|nr:hypothetical protein GPDM_15469 [Planococcus donghaensis MPA1U2]